MRNHTIILPIEVWRLLVKVLEGVTWIHPAFQDAVSSLQVQVSRYREPATPVRDAPWCSACNDVTCGGEGCPTLEVDT